MSYDVDLRCSHCGHTARDWSPTYNLSQIFDFLLTGEDFPSSEVSEAEAVLLRKPVERPRGLRVLNGSTGAESVERLTRAVERAHVPEHQSKLIEMQPSNGWGTLSGAIEVLQEMLAAAQDYPDLKWKIR